MHHPSHFQAKQEIQALEKYAGDLSMSQDEAEKFKKYAELHNSLYKKETDKWLIYDKSTQLIVNDNPTKERLVSLMQASLEEEIDDEEERKQDKEELAKEGSHNRQYRRD